MRKSVLIVEDEYLIASELALLLGEHGWQVIGPVGTTSDALALLHGELPSVALLDLNLGDELVTPVALALKQEGVPFVLATAVAQPEQYGGDVFAGILNIGKTVIKDNLIATLENLVASTAQSSKIAL